MIKNMLQVRLVSDLIKSKEYYRDILGFEVDGWGHTVREGVGFMLQPAKEPSDVQPNAKPSDRNYPLNWPAVRTIEIRQETMSWRRCGILCLEFR